MKNELDLLNDVYEWASRNYYTQLRLVPRSIVANKNGFSIRFRNKNHTGKLIFKYIKNNKLYLENII